MPMASPTRSAPVALGTLTVLSALYFAQGLPYGFFTQALPVVLRDSGFSLTKISLTGVLFAPWALKFLWAPYVDRYGTRRQWLLTLQLASAMVAVVLACLDLSSTLTWLFVGVAVINLLSATQDVATDGLAVNMLGPRQRGLANGIQVGAYRIGMIAGGGGLLWLFALAGWRSLFLAMALLIIVTTVPIWSLRAGQHDSSNAGTDDPPRARPSGGWLRRVARPGMLVFILLIGAFKFGDSMGSTLVGPYMTDAGLSLGQIALVKGALSSAGALAGAALGGWLAFRFGRRPALIFGGVTQTISLGLFLTSAVGGGGFALIVVASLAEHILGGAATVALFTLMMDASEPRFAGSDYTLMACAVVVVQGFSGVVGGVIGDTLGYPAVFGTSLVLSGIGCAVLIFALDRGAGPAGIRSVWRAPSGHETEREAA